MSDPPRDTVVRFTASERVFHWAQALPYLVLLVSGALLLLERNLPFEWVAVDRLVTIHEVAGIALPVAMFLAFLGGDKRLLLANAAAALRWSRADVKWLLFAPLGRVLAPGVLPPSGKFNAGQKLNIVMQLVLIPIFLVTGLFMWLEGEALLSWCVHVGAFVVAVPLVLGHLYLALIHPSTRKGLSGVFGGRVDREWAMHHYPLEYGPVHDAGMRAKDGSP